MKTPSPVVPRSRLARSATSFATLSLAFAAPFAAWAQTTVENVYQLPDFTVSSEAADRYRAEDAVSAVRVRAPLIDTASSISVITRDMMDDLAPNRIFDVARYVAGVQDGRGMQFQDRMIIRGFESQNGARTVDNFLQPADADNINEAVIERIEISKGPNAILSPSGAPGGSVNIITKSPSFKAHRSLTAQVGLFDSQKATLDLGGAVAGSDKFAFRVVGALQDTRRYWSADARMRTRSLAPMLLWRISDRTTFTAKLVAAEAWIYREPLLIIDSKVNAATDDPYLAPGVKAKGLNGIAPWSHVGTHTADLFTQLTTSFNEHISLRLAANGRYYFEDSDQMFLSTPSLNSRYNPATGELTQDYTWTLVNGAPVSTYSPFYDPTAVPVRGDIQATRRKTVNLQADVAANYKFGSVSSQTVTGAALSRQTGYGRGRSGTLPAVNLYNLVEAYPVYASTFAFYNRNGYTNTQFYLNERLGFFKDRLYLTAGILRFDTKTVARNALNANPASILDDTKNMTSFSALYKVRDNVSLYASRSKNSSPVIANSQPLWRDGNQDELGFKTEWFGRRLSVNGSYFEIEQTNVTIPNPDRQTDPTAPEQLIADYGNKGWELEVMGSLTKNVSAIATYSHLKMRDALGRMVRGVADNNASLLLNYRVTEGSLKNLAVNFGVSYSGKRAGDTPINYTSLNVVGKTSFFLKPHYSTTAGASYRWSEKLTTRLTIDNVFNEKDYISIAGGRVSGTGITTAPGLNLRLTTTWNF